MFMTSILLSPTKDFVRAKLRNGRQNSRMSMLTHDSKGIVQKHEKCGQSCLIRLMKINRFTMN